MVMKRYSKILASLSELAESSLSDSETVTVALGLRKRMKNIRVIISMKILKLVYNIIGPVSKAVQGILIDMASATELIKDCIHQFDIIRRNADLTWKTICSESKSFATAHGISPDFDFERRRTKKKMFDERCSDECSVGINKMKNECFLIVLDEVNQQMKNRFEQQNLVFLKELSLFTPKTLLSNRCVKTSEIETVCSQYSVNAEDVANELNEFKKAYTLLKNDEKMENLSAGSGYDSGMEIFSDKSDEEDDNNNMAYKEAQTNDTNNWKNCSFIKPLNVLPQLSQFADAIQNICFSCFIKYLCRKSFKLKIIKNRLRAWNASKTQEISIA
ncbi:hypothetical protein HELRODRAFT_165422 [Helobdella robusta]|uniref:Uncharacterized protein n=1 Tax=Helobdella robusta TaxID=6412 RepID=T1EWR6_HELRO|nr:hypothetical protein HELRODRAFT_165422 [Helobdella robusta]ESN91393.1 hypothetical protein HELRODRAFT_165422 [Helobdella robusta]